MFKKEDIEKIMSIISDVNNVECDDGNLSLEEKIKLHKEALEGLLAKKAKYSMDSEEAIEALDGSHVVEDSEGRKYFKTHGQYFVIKAACNVPEDFLEDKQFALSK